MWPLVGIPQSILQGLTAYRSIFFREAGFVHVSRYVTGLLLSPYKTLQGIYSQWVFPEGEPVSRRAMHEAVFEAGWDREALMVQHRRVVAQRYQGQGRQVIGLDWTLAHHERSNRIYGVKRSFDYVENRMSRYQTVMTAAVSNRQTVDGLAVEVQAPKYEAEEKAYLEMTTQESYEEMAQVRERLVELLHYQKNRLVYRKRTEMAVDLVRQIEAEGQFPQAHYAFDNGVLCRPLTELIEQSGKHWVSELEKTRLILWDNQWQAVGAVANGLRRDHPESFRPYTVRGRNGTVKDYWAFTKVVRLKKYGRKRLVIVHEQADLSDPPRFLLTDALTWESGRILSTWSYRWPIEVFHEFCKQVAGFEAAQLRNEEAVKRHFCLSCLAQSLLQQAPALGRTSERLSFADDTQQTIGQKHYGLMREALEPLLELVKAYFDQGRSVAEVVEVLMPA
jgi:hypothetical protein